jgi:hypothetical protein
MLRSCLLFSDHMLDACVMMRSLCSLVSLELSRFLDLSHDLEVVHCLVADTCYMF